jgi:hypothetical protein
MLEAKAALALGSSAAGGDRRVIPLLVEEARAGPLRPATPRGWTPFWQGAL